MKLIHNIALKRKECSSLMIFIINVIASVKKSLSSHCINSFALIKKRRLNCIMHHHHHIGIQSKEKNNNYYDDHDKAVK